MKCQKVSAQILCSTRHETQDLRQPTQHLHLLGTGGRVLTGLGFAAAQFFQESHGTGAGLAHVELAHVSQLDHLGGGHDADHGGALIAAGLQVGQNRLKVVFQKQHGDDNDVSSCNISFAARQLVGIRCVF